MPEEMNAMNDLGESYPSNPCGCDDCQKREEGKEDKKHYPRESFTTEQMPELKGLTVGDKVRVVFEAEVCSVSQGDEYGIAPGGDDGETKTRVSLKMLRGSATKSSAESSVETVADEKKKKAKDFGKMIGMTDDGEDSPEEE